MDRKQGLVQDTYRPQIKERLYNFIAHGGIWLLETIFPEYFAVEPLRPTDRYIEYPFVLSNIPKPQQIILDVGCSGSMFPLMLDALGCITYGMDIREYPIKNKFKFIQDDICHTKFNDNTFDVVTAVSTIEHIGLKGRYGTTDGSDYKAIKEIYRILKPNGIFLMTVPYGKEFKQFKKHRVYDNTSITCLLYKFGFTYQIEQSPEADYQLALIRAVK